METEISIGYPDNGDTGLTREEKTEQQINAIAMSNRLTVAEIKLKRAGRLSNTFRNEMKQINDSIFELTDSMILGEDVRSGLDVIDERVKQFERRIAA